MSGTVSEMSSRVGSLGIVILTARLDSVRHQQAELEKSGHKCAVVDSPDAAVAHLRGDESCSVVVAEGERLGNGAASFLSAVYSDRESREITVLGFGCERLRERLQDLGERMFLPTPWTIADVVQRVERRRLGMAIANLHDVFLNASLLKKLMDGLPLEKEENDSLAGDRWRAERLWIAHLAILTECWRSRQMRYAVQFIRGVTDTADLVGLLRDAAKQHADQDMFEVRHYICHRDQRNYWDRGRLAPVGQLPFFLQLHNAFSRVLLEGFRAINVECQQAI